MDAFGPRDDAAVEYWFWKLHVGRLAFLLDFIVRRASGRGEVRVSLWLDEVGRVIHDETTALRLPPGDVTIGRSTLTPGAAVGGTGDVEWDLRWTSGDTFVNPIGGLVARFQPFDTTLVVWPHVRFTGSVTVAGERVAVDGVPGTFNHYWGRRIPSRWVWVSATHFEDEPERRLEGVFGVGTRLFGRLPSVIPIHILWTSDGRQVEEIASGITGLIRARPDVSGLRVSAIGRSGRRHRLAASWGAVTPNDLGEGIIQTMHADATFDGHRAEAGTVGLEVRGFPHPVAR